MPKLSPKKFNAKLAELSEVISQINRERYSVSTHNADKLLKLTTSFTENYPKFY